MTATIPKTALQLRSLVKPTGELELSLASVDIPTPADNEVVIRIEASPINPSDIGLLFGAADMSTASVSAGRARPGRYRQRPGKGHEGHGGAGWACRCRSGTKAQAWSLPPARPTPRRS